MTRQRRKPRRGPLAVTYSPATGVHLEGTVVWMDGFPPQGLAFVSHAHVRVPKKAGRLLATWQTAVLAGLEDRDLLSCPFDRPVAVGRVDLELASAGHVPGSASLLLVAEGRRYLYAGAVNPRTSVAGAEPCQPRRCDVLVLGCRYGHPRFLFPDANAELERLAGRIRAVLGRGRTPVLVLRRPLGKAQALAAWLHTEGYEVWAHKAICEMAVRVRRLGLPAGTPRRIKSGSRVSGVVLWLAGSRSEILDRVVASQVRLLVSGDAQDPVALAQYQVAEGFILSEHADYPALLSYVEQTGARTVHLLPGRPHGLAAELRRRNLKVSLLRPVQLRLF